MGLREVAIQAANTAFAAADNLKIPCVFIATKPGYDAATGEVTDSGEEYSIKAIRAEYDERESKLEYHSNDNFFKLLVLASGLPNAKLIDKVNIDGIIHDIVGFKTDPATAVYEFKTKAVS